MTFRNRHNDHPIAGFNNRKSTRPARGRLRFRGSTVRFPNGKHPAIKNPPAFFFAPNEPLFIHENKIMLFWLLVYGAPQGN
jgi:hypothetical protein